MKRYWFVSYQLTEMVCRTTCHFNRIVECVHPAIWFCHLAEAVQAYQMLTVYFYAEVTGDDVEELRKEGLIK